jgi:hypothetical protein
MLASAVWLGSGLASGCNDTRQVRRAPENVATHTDAGRPSLTAPSRDASSALPPAPDAQQVGPADAGRSAEEAGASLGDPQGPSAERDAGPLDGILVLELGPIERLMPIEELVPDEADGGRDQDEHHAAVAPKGVSCDARKVVCKRARPLCPAGQVPSVAETCWGDCAPIDHCACTEAAACPERETYVCHMSAGHCGPYVN